MAGLNPDRTGNFLAIQFEFDNVFVPGMAKDLLPSNKLQHNPATRGKSMDFELRGDTDILPKLDDFGGVVRKFWQALKDQELIEERRTCYVALTRARRRLFVSGAHWYGETDRPKRPSEFFEELAEWGEESGDALVDRGPEQSSDNPLAGYRERLVRDDAIHVVVVVLVGRRERGGIPLRGHRFVEHGARLRPAVAGRRADQNHPGHRERHAEGHQSE